MTPSRQVRVRFFGAFRKYFEGKAELDLALPAGLTAGAARSQIGALLSVHNSAFPLPSDRELLAQSALADESRILSDSDTLDRVQELSILPPVCGG